MSKGDEAPTSPPRDHAGRWLRGVSPNPGGRPRDTERVRDLARALIPEAMEVLARVMRDENAAPAQRIAAASAVLDRAVGKPIAMVAETDSEGEDIPREQAGASAVERLAIALERLNSGETGPEINDIKRRLNFVLAERARSRSGASS